ncbi:hypothetical protein K2Q02_02145 [Patescibacteria group bacterium]|nr:hypothetical protein [Patescibacteria group bacterium]
MPTKISEKKKNNRDTGYTLREFEKPFETALYFGFLPVKTPEITKEDLQNLKAVKDSYYEPKRIQTEAPFTFDVLEKIALLRSFEAWGFEHTPQPVLIAYKKPLSGTFNKKSSEFTMGLEVLGLATSSAEALALRATLSILEDEGFKNLSIHLNSLGDKDSVGDFERMVSGFVRKHMNGFPADIRKMAKSDIFDILRSNDPKHSDVQGQAPKSLSFLSENSRDHFKEVLEHIESFNVPYTIAHRLIGATSFCSHTIFEIRNGDGDQSEVLAHGYRYSRLSKKVGFKREVPALGITISFKKKEKKPLSKGIGKSRFYLIQLGFGAKLMSLPVIEMLRKARITIIHALAKDKLSSQLGSAENSKVPYILIIGQKEAIEKSVVVRNVSTRAQESIGVDKLVEYLKNLK